VGYELPGPPEEERAVSTGLEKLHTLGSDDIAPAAATLATAFQDDPVWAALFEGLPAEKMAAWYQGPVLYCLRYGRVYATSDGCEGVMCVVPGEYANMTMRRGIASGSMTAGLKAGPGMLLRLPQMMRTFRPMENDRKEHMEGRGYTYVMIVGVAPEHQGQGLGGKLLRALLEESDRTGVPIYLETETEGNRDMYEHLGFKLLQEIALPEVDLPMWEFLREPAT
jgi:GNAT superfamily N-acetyltransferase